MDDVFAVIAERTRREILACLRAGDRSVGQLVEELKVSQPTVSKHLKVLREAGLVSMRAQGQKRYYALETAPLCGIAEWLDSFARNDPRLADHGLPVREGSDTAGPSHSAGNPPSEGPPAQAEDVPSETLAAAALAVPGTNSDSVRVAVPEPEGRPDAGLDTGAEVPPEGTRQQHLGRTVGRAAERAADLLSQFRRRRDQER